ncbi:MAG: hypothetical protein ABJB11_05475 [Ferruginibacter sp.]
MPQSKTRHHRHPQQHHGINQSNNKKSNKVMVVAIAFCAFVGLGMSYFVTSGSMFSLTAGTIVGGIAGYFFGHQIKKAFSKK